MKEKHLLQSSVWAEYEKIEGRQVFEAQGQGWSAVAWLNSTKVGNYLMVGYGPWVESEGFSAEKRKKCEKTAVLGGFSEAFSGLKRLAEENQAFFVRIEPTFRLSEEKIAEIAKKQGMTAKKVKEIEPEHTWVLDLTVPREELLRNMESNKVRSWRNAEKKGMTIRKTQDAAEIGVLTRLLAGVGERDHFTPQDEKHLENQMKAGFATLYIVELEEEKRKIPIAAALIYSHEGVSYYAHAGSDEKFKKLRAGAVLLVQTIVDAQEKGDRIYDFWGITTSENPEHPWYGFTQFKKSFGGRQVDYSGTYDLILSEKKYKLYNTLRKANLWARKLRK